MQRSTEIDKLAAALVKAQSEMPVVKRDGSAEIEDRNKSYQYTSLSELLISARPILSKHGLCVIQNGTERHVDGHIGIETTVMHESGQFLSGEMMIPFTTERNAAQSAGAAVTYCRRYAFSSFLGITSEEDTDAGRPASTAAPKAKKPAPSPAPKPVAAPKPKPAPEPSTEGESPEEASHQVLVRAMKAATEIMLTIQNEPSRRVESIAKIRHMIDHATMLNRQSKMTNEHLQNLKDMTAEVLNEQAD